MGSLPGKRKATVVAVASTIAIVAAVAPETFVIATKEPVAIGLLVPVTVVSAGIAVAIPVKVRSLRIIALSSLRIARASVEAVLVTLVYGVLIDVAITTIAAVIAVPTAVAAGAIIATIIAIAPVVLVTIIVTVASDPIAVATILIASILTILITGLITGLITVPRPLGLRRRVRSQSNAYKEGQCQQDSPDFVPEIV